MRSKGNKDEDDGDKETRGNPSGNDVVAIRGIELHPAEQKIENMKKLFLKEST